MHVLTVLPVDLILGDDDLARVHITSVGDGVTKDADCSDHLTHFFDTVHGVAGVADQLFAPSNLWWGRTNISELRKRSNRCISLQNVKLQKVCVINENRENSAD